MNPAAFDAGQRRIRPDARSFVPWLCDSAWEASKLPQGHGVTILVACAGCNLVQRVQALAKGRTQARCARCGVKLPTRKPNSLARTAALSLAALLLYVPANAYPIMRMTYMGRASENTIWSGCRQLFHDGDYGVAVVVFCASILIPLLKLLGLFFLVATAHSTRWQQADRARVFRIVDAIGRWSMLDVFLLSIMVGLVKLGNIATVMPGPGMTAFAAVVILTMLASASFDPRMIWEAPEETT